MLAGFRGAGTCRAALPGGLDEAVVVGDGVRQRDGVTGPGVQ